VTGDRDRPRIAIFGLGEAGGAIAGDLAGRGADVQAFDPAPCATPDGVTRHDEPSSAVADVAAVLAVTHAADAETAVLQALDDIPQTAVYADLSTAAPAVKRRLAELAGWRGIAFADVALMSAVPGKGLATPQLVSGAGADHYLRVLSVVGGAAMHVGGQPGDAATRKLLRSIMIKGLAALLIEAMHGATAVGLRDWLWDHITAELTTLDVGYLRRLVEGTGRHAERRQYEMQAAARLLADLGVEPLMTAATADSLRAARSQPLPELPPQPPS
jgi:3-hydroxyisobutyrate dehydrogenase-like beta-hydroxyacid dehydrogenase